ncbi:MAG TPA: hypothetical protein VMI75_36240 [Polyangiaceae bacterium]|nr:hypothetical protein [Polyangiaceae bacterium]
MAARRVLALLLVAPAVAIAPIVSCGGSARSSGQDGGSPDASGDVTSPGLDAPEDVLRDAVGEGGGNIEGGTVDAPVCMTDLSDVGTGDFTIRFTLTTNETGMTLALLNQRLGCDQMSTFWDISLSPTGNVVVATDDSIAADYVTVQAGSALNDGKAHQVAVIRRAGKLWITADGAVISPMTPDAYLFATFSSLAIGTSACMSESPAAAYAVIANVCLAEP